MADKNNYQRGYWICVAIDTERKKMYANVSRMSMSAADRSSIGGNDADVVTLLGDTFGSSFGVDAEYGLGDSRGLGSGSGSGSGLRMWNLV